MEEEEEEEDNRIVCAFKCWSVEVVENVQELVEQKRRVNDVLFCIIIVPFSNYPL